MGITIGWDNNEKTVIRFTFEDLWDWNDLHAARMTGHQMIDEVNRKVDFIADLTRSAFIPAGGLNNLRVLAQNVHPQSGVVAVVGISLYGRTLSEMYLRLFTHHHLQMFFTADIRSARALIAEHRVSSNGGAANGS